MSPQCPPSSLYWCEQHPNPPQKCQDVPSSIGNGIFIGIVVAIVLGLLFNLWALKYSCDEID